MCIVYSVISIWIDILSNPIPNLHNFLIIYEKLLLISTCLVSNVHALAFLFSIFVFPQFSSIPFPFPLLSPFHLFLWIHETKYIHDINKILLACKSGNLDSVSECIQEKKCIAYFSFFSLLNKYNKIILLINDLVNCL